MTALDNRIDAAWESPEPNALHRAAEQLASQGHGTSAIYDALEKLLLKLREAGAGDEAEERITDVMDRLTGWCHESNQIHPSRVTLPSEVEIARQP